MVTRYEWDLRCSDSKGAGAHGRLGIHGTVGEMGAVSGKIKHFGVPPNGNANVGWAECSIRHVTLRGMVRFDFVNLSVCPVVLGKCIMSSNQSS
jgi:hypothetical protein